MDADALERGTAPEADVVIRARGLCKTYRLYTRPAYRVLDMFGLLPRRPSRYYTEHAALDHVTLDIAQGEKLALIGRNGAGKSTLLRLITGVIEPSAGSLQVKGKVQALLQIGTGFHPDFSGRENVYSYLAQLGVTGAEAARRVEEIVAFAELEDYIDQPVKTYSTGMGVRLMFAASTSITPDLLVLDEVLGVGDAYFQQKSFERIQELCRDRGTTLLLVTHDVYSAMKICNRFVWLDHGRVMMDGSSSEVVHAYEQSIRAQEEHRLRLKRTAALERNLNTSICYGQIQLPDGGPPASSLFISELRIVSDNGETATLSGETATGLMIVDADSNWGAVEMHHGRTARPFSRHGSIFHKLPFALTDPAVVKALAEERAHAELTAWVENTPLELDLTLYTDNGRVPYSTRLHIASPDCWLKAEGALVRGAVRGTMQSRGTIRYGARAFEIVGVRFENEAEEALQFDVGSTLRVRLQYRINDSSFSERPVIIVAFQKDGIVRTHRFWTDAIRFSAAEAREGEILISASPLQLGAGAYAVTVSAYREGYFDGHGRHRFFAASADVLDIHSRAYEIVVRESRNPLLNDVVFQHPAEWAINGKVVATTVVARDQEPAVSRATGAR